MELNHEKSNDVIIVVSNSDDDVYDVVVLVDIISISRGKKYSIQFYLVRNQFQDCRLKDNKGTSPQSHESASCLQLVAGYWLGVVVLVRWSSLEKKVQTNGNRISCVLGTTST